MADPGGMNSMLQSQLAAGSGGGGEAHTNPFTFIMTFGNIGGGNILAPIQHFAGKMGLTAAFGWLGSALGLKSIRSDILEKSPVGKPLSKKAKKMGGHNFGLAAGGPSVAPPALGSPQAPGGKNMGH